MGWTQFKAAEIGYKDGQLPCQGKAISLWDSYGLSDYDLRMGCFSEDALPRGIYTRWRRDRYRTHQWWTTPRRGTQTVALRFKLLQTLHGGRLADFLAFLYALNAKSTLDLRCSMRPGESPFDTTGKPVIPRNVSIREHRRFANSQPHVMAKIAAGRLTTLAQNACDAAWSNKPNSPFDY